MKPPWRGTKSRRAGLGSCAIQDNTSLVFVWIHLASCHIDVEILSAVRTILVSGIIFPMSPSQLTGRPTILPFLLRAECGQHPLSNAWPFENAAAITTKGLHRSTCADKLGIVIVTNRKRTAWYTSVQNLKRRYLEFRPGRRRERFKSRSFVSLAFAFAAACFPPASSILRLSGDSAGCERRNGLVGVQSVFSAW